MKVEFKKVERCIELPNGDIYDVPERTASISESIEKIEEGRDKRSEYEHYKSVLEVLFGKANFKKIAPKGKDENLDFLAVVYATAMRVFFEDKEKIQADEIARRMNTLKPIASEVEKIQPLLNK